MRTYTVKEELDEIKGYIRSNGRAVLKRLYPIQEGIGPDGYIYGPMILGGLYYDILKALKATKVKEFTLTRIDHEKIVLEYKTGKTYKTDINKGQMILNYEEN